MVDQLCQAYHWSYGEAMSRTMPQIVMLNHASWVNSKRMDARIEARKDKNGGAPEDPEDPVVYRGKRLSKLNTDEMAAYMNEGI